MSLDQAKLDELSEALAKELIDQGKLIEAGFEIFQRLAYPNAGAHQIADLHCTFFAGAQHVFATIMQTTDEEEEPTEADMLRIQKIHDELDLFGKDLALKLARSRGNT